MFSSSLPLLILSCDTTNLSPFLPCILEQSKKKKNRGIKFKRKIQKQKQATQLDHLEKSGNFQLSSSKSCHSAQFPNIVKSQLLIEEFKKLHDAAPNSLQVHAQLSLWAVILKSTAFGFLFRNLTLHVHFLTTWPWTDYHTCSVTLDKSFLPAEPHMSHMYPPHGLGELNEMIHSNT